MKRLLVIAILLLTCSLSAQEVGSGRKIKQMTVTQRVPSGNDMNMVEIWHYDDQGNPDSVTKQGFGGRQTYAYHSVDPRDSHRWSEDKLIDSIYHQNVLWKILKYDGDNDIVELHFFGTRTGELMSSSYYVYVKPHVLRTKKSYHFDKGYLSEISYCWYDKNGHLIKTETYSPDERLVMLETYKNDKKGNNVKRKMVEYNEDGKVVKTQVEERRYKYDDEGNWTLCEFYTDGKMRYYTTREIIYQ